MDAYWHLDYRQFLFIKDALENIIWKNDNYCVKCGENSGEIRLSTIKWNKNLIVCYKCGNEWWKNKVSGKIDRKLKPPPGKLDGVFLSFFFRFVSVIPAKAGIQDLDPGSVAGMTRKLVSPIKRPNGC